MTIYPAIDIKNGRAVRLLQGRADQETVYASNPADVAKVFKETGSPWVHVVDLDGAFDGAPANFSKVEEIVATGLKVQLGGGMRNRETVARALDMGVTRVVVGTRAVESEAFLKELVNEFGDKIAVGIDAKDGKVAVKGWVSTTGTSALDLARSMDQIGVKTLIYTDIGTDGMLTGPNLSAQEEMAAAVSATIIASGGVSRREDVLALAEIEKRRPNLGGVIVGKALYEKRVELSDLLTMV